MKISIVNPNLSGDVSILDIGITCLVTYIDKRTSHQASIIDFTFHRKAWRQHLKKRLLEEDPDVIGLSATSLYMPYCVDIIRESKKIKPSLNVIMGGWHCCVDPDDAINNYPFVESIIIGDGEFALEEYLDRVASGAGLDGIKGLWFRNGDGRIVKNEKRSLIEDLDALPEPDYDYWKDIDKYLFYNQMLYVMGNRGCPFSCTYCSEAVRRENVPGAPVRFRDPRKFVHEIRRHWEKYSSRGMRVAHIFDPVFPLNREWLAEFIDEYKKTGLADTLPFSCFSRIDTVDEEKVRMLASANCKIIRIGIEAGNEAVRNEIYKKNITNEQYRMIFDLIHSEGIKVTGYTMLGGPGESKRTLSDTFKMVRELRVDRPIFFTYRPLPKTAAVKLLKEHGGIITGWKGIDSLHRQSNVKSDELSPGYILFFRYRCLVYFTLKRTVKLVRKQGVIFFINLIRYIIAGLRDRLYFEYIIGYFYVCAGDNLYE